jgi:hypothetical protein
MTEKINHELEQRESRTSRPSLLDLVKVDGRWAQVGPGPDSIAFLDEKTGKQYHVAHEINWDEYEFVPLNEHFVGDLVDQSKISLDDYNKIVRGPEQDQYPKLKRDVTVFGEYKKIKENVS